MKGITITGAFDIECAAWDRLVCACLYSPAMGTRTVRSADDLTDALLEREGTWWSWNGGRYDMLQVAEVLRRRGIPYQVNLSGSTVSSLVAGKLKLVDACMLIPMPLDDAAELCGRVPSVLGWPCRCGTDCGGYCGIRTGMSEKRRRQLEGYCAQDAAICYHAVATVLTLCADLGLSARATLGGTAWATAQAWAGLPDATWSGRTWRQVRSAYYGGRVLVARPQAPAGYHFDLASAYPAALAETKVPLGEPAEAGGRRARLAFARGIPGIYRATVRVPESFVPPLPMRGPDQQVWFPLGEMTGAWTASELAVGLDRGVQLVDIHECVAFPDGEDSVLADPVRRWYAERIRAGKASALGRWWRLLCNSVTGKLAERPERHSVVVNPTRTPVICAPGLSHSERAGCNLQRCTGECGAWHQVDRWGEVWSVPYYRMGTCSHVHWAAYLTAATRATVLRGMDEVGDEHLVYSDTDSLWCTDGAPSPLGEGMGQWSQKGAWGDFQARAQKAYRFISTDGEVVCRVAGIGGMTPAEWDAGKRIQARGVRTFLEAAAASDGLFRRRYSLGKLTEPGEWFGDRRLDGPSGRTYPVPYGELIEKGRSGRRGEGGGTEEGAPAPQEGVAYPQAADRGEAPF